MKPLSSSCEGWSKKNPIKDEMYLPFPPYFNENLPRSEFPGPVLASDRRSDTQAAAAALICALSSGHSASFSKKRPGTSCAARAWDWKNRKTEKTPNFFSRPPIAARAEIYLKDGDVIVRATPPPPFTRATTLPLPKLMSYHPTEAY